MRFHGLEATRTGAVLLAFGMAGLVAACSDDVTGPNGETGAMEAYVQDRPAGEQEAGSYMTAASSDDGTASQGGSSYSGTFSADAQVAISADGEAWIELGPPASASLDLQASGDGANVHGEVEVPVGTYTRVRLVLNGAEARIDAGSSIGGINLTANVTMTVGAQGQVVIEKEVPPFEVRADTRTRVFWDLNSHLWVNEDNVEDEEVEEEEVDDSAEPRTESEPRDQQMN